MLHWCPALGGDTGTITKQTQLDEEDADNRTLSDDESTSIWSALMASSPLRAEQGARNERRMRETEGI